MVEVIQHEVLPGLDVLTKGMLPIASVGTADERAFPRRCSKSSKRRYDLVIIDTPPVLAVTDSTVIGKYAGTTLLVVRYGRQPIAEIGETAKRLRTVA